MIQMTIADVYFVHQRGRMNSIYIWSANVGSNLAVVAAGFITTSQGWRWVWWWCAIWFGVQLFMFVFGFEETKFTHIETLEGRQGSVNTVPDISAHSHDSHGKEKRPRATGGDADVELDLPPSNLNVVQINHSIPRKTYWQKLALTTTSPGSWLTFLRHSWQPFLILASIPGVLFCSLVYAILLAWSTVMTTVLSTLMLEEPYNFSASSIGLMSLAPCM